MVTEIEKNQEDILKYLYKVDEESNGEIAVKGDDIKNSLNFKPSEINNAISLLHDAGLIKWFYLYGNSTIPVLFSSNNALWKTYGSKDEIKNE